jgi:hypothetical protein
MTTSHLPRRALTQEGAQGERSMFSTFYKGEQAVIVRTADIRRIEDVESGCEVVWDEAGETQSRAIDGTAKENLDRLIVEDLERQDIVARARKRQEAGYPGMPVQRGKVNAS